MSISKCQMTNNSRILDKDGRERTAISQQMEGFTLIELLVVIAIIGILAAMGIISYMGVQKQARDASRQSDLKQYQTLLGEYAGSHKGLYPIQATEVNVCTSLSTQLGLAACFDDPRVAAPALWTPYKYISDATGATYLIYTDLEKDGLATGYWYLCSGGKVSTKAGTPVLTDCN